MSLVLILKKYRYKSGIHLRVGHKGLNLLILFSFRFRFFVTELPSTKTMLNLHLVRIGFSCFQDNLSALGGTFLNLVFWKSAFCLSVRDMITRT